MTQARDSMPADDVDAMLDDWRTERPDLDPSAMAVVLRVHILSSQLAERLKDALAPLGLAPWEFDVLSALRRAGRSGGRTPKELCQSAQLTSGAMTHRLDRLEEKGWLRRRVAKDDRRSITVHLTPKGRTVVDRAVEARMEDAVQCVAGLKPTDQSSLARLLKKLGTGLTKHSKP